MTQQKRKPWLTAAALVVAGLVVAGLGVWTSDPVQKAMALAEVAQEKPLAAEGAGGDPAGEAADEDRAAAAEEKKAAAEEEAAAAEESRIAAADEAAAAQEGKPPQHAAGPADDEACCKQGDTTSPIELAAPSPAGRPAQSVRLAATRQRRPRSRQAIPPARMQRVSWRWRRWWLLSGAEPGRLVLGQYRRRAVPADRAGLRRPPKARLRTDPVGDGEGADADDGTRHQDVRSSVEDRLVHPVDQSARDQSSGEGHPGPVHTTCG